MNPAVSIIIAILVFGVLIFTHELGHFIVAKLSNVKVNEFAVGMGPALFKIKRGETTYALRILPIGGYCAMEGEDEESSDERAFNKKPVWQKILVVVAGAFTNIVTGFILVVILTCISQAIATTTVAKFDSQATSNAPGGMQVGDQIYRINGARVHVSSDIMYDLVLDSDGVVDIQVIRDGKLVDLKNVQFPMMDDGNGGKVIRRDFWVVGQKKTFFNVLHESFFQTISMVRLVWVTFLQLFTGRFGLKDLAGPIGTTAAVGQAAAAGLPDLLYVAALIAVNLGVVNLFPLPALDGGRLFFLIIEGIRRKPINPKYEGYIHFAGFALLMALMVIVSFNDIMRLIKG
nr:MAG: RIP metalloprotease RseP [[Clostridium] cellulosi]